MNVMPKDYINIHIKRCMDSKYLAHHGNHCKCMLNPDKNTSPLMPVGHCWEPFLFSLKYSDQKKFYLTSTWKTSGDLFYSSYSHKPHTVTYELWNRPESVCCLIGQVQRCFWI